MVFTLTKPSLKQSIPTEKRPKTRSWDVKDTLTKETLETVPPLSLQAEEQKPDSQEVTLFGKVAADIFSCDKHPLSGVTLRISFVRSKPEFALIYDADAKN